MIDGAALRTDRALMQFLLNLIGVEDVILLGVSGNAGVWSAAFASRGFGNQVVAGGET